MAGHRRSAFSEEGVSIKLDQELLKCAPAHVGDIQWYLRNVQVLPEICSRN